MIGDDISITEETYISKIGSLVVTIDLLVKRIAAKDKALIESENEIARLKAELAQTKEK